MERTVVLYINTLAYGGAERVMVQLANGLALNGYRIILITTYHREKEYCVSKGIERIVLESGNTVRNGIRKNLGYIAKIRAICRNNDAVVIVSFMREPNVRALLATIGLKTRSLISVRCDPSREYPGLIGKLMRMLLLPMSDGCVFQTEDAKKCFPSKLIKKSRVILNPVAKEFFDVRQENPHNIVTVCRLDRQKNISLLIRAFARIEDKYPEEKLLIYGEGSSRNELEKLISSLQLNEKVILMGNSANIPEVLSKAKIFALASDFEGLPNALMEALAVGVPSVATDCPCGGPRILIEDGINGLLVPVNDEVILAEAIGTLLSNQELSYRLGNEAVKRAREQYYPKVILNQWLDFIEDTVGK